MRHTIRRATVALALTPVLSLPAVAAYAGTSGDTVSVPAPPGDASAVAAEVDGVVTVAKTRAHAGSDGGTASADALSVLGTQISGGEQKGNGDSSDALFDTGATPVGRVDIGAWSAKVAQNGDSTESAAEASLAHADIAGAAEVYLLHSRSHATWNDDASTGDSESDGAEISALDTVDVKVLHSEAHSTGKSQSSLLVVNGTPVVTSDDVDGNCALDASPVIDLSCLTASGGKGADGIVQSVAQVVGADIGDGALIATGVGTSTQGGSAAPAETPNEPRVTTHQGGRLPHTGGEVPTGLPFTGDDTGRMAAIAAALAALGVAVTAHGRRRRGHLFG